MKSVERSERQIPMCSQFLQKLVWGLLPGGPNANIGQILRPMGVQLKEIDFFCCF